MKKLLASDVLEIDDKFLDEVRLKLDQRKELDNKVEQLFTVHQVADYTNVKPSTVRKHIKDGILKATKVGKNWLISEEQYNNYTTRKDE